jgi:hypothetical protein
MYNAIRGLVAKNTPLQKDAGVKGSLLHNWNFDEILFEVQVGAPWALAYWSESCHDGTIRRVGQKNVTAHEDREKTAAEIFGEAGQHFKKAKAVWIPNTNQFATYHRSVIGIHFVDSVVMYEFAGKDFDPHRRLNHDRGTHS